MDDILYTALNRYFNTLKSFGYKSYNDVNKLLFIVIIRDILLNNSSSISEEDYKILDKALYKVLGTSCLFPYPQYCSGKSDINIQLLSL